MEQSEKVRREDTKRLLEWIGENRDAWLDIIQALTEEDILIGRELKEVIHNLGNNGFYQLLVLLMYAKSEIIRRALEKSILSVICSSWDEKSIDKMIDLLIDNIS